MAHPPGKSSPASSRSESEKQETSSTPPSSPHEEGEPFSSQPSSNKNPDDPSPKEQEPEFSSASSSTEQHPNEPEPKPWTVKELPDDSYDQEYYHGEEYDSGYDAGGGYVPPTYPPVTHGGAGDPEPESWTEEEEGGPVKTFLEHLEDLRWVLIKSGASVMIAMVACLVAANYLISALTWPLEQAQRRFLQDKQVVQITAGTNELFQVTLQTNQFGQLNLGTNKLVEFQLVPILIGTNQVLALQPVEKPTQFKKQKVSQIALKNYSPVGPFVVALQLALYGGIGLASPFVLFFVGQFIFPALRRAEKKVLYRALGFGTLLFVLGVVFCYFLMVQVALNAAVKFAGWMNFGADEWAAETYISFVCKFMLGMGLAFELPVVILTLVKLELMDYERLIKFRPYWVVINMVLSSVLTPPDPVSMAMMAIPLQILYEISAAIAKFWGRKKKEREAQGQV